MDKLANAAIFAAQAATLFRNCGILDDRHKLLLKAVEPDNIQIADWECVLDSLDEIKKELFVAARDAASQAMALTVPSIQEDLGVF